MLGALKEPELFVVFIGGRPSDSTAPRVLSYPAVIMQLCPEGLLMAAVGKPPASVRRPSLCSPRSKRQWVAQIRCSTHWRAPGGARVGGSLAGEARALSLERVHEKAGDARFAAEDGRRR